MVKKDINVKMTDSGDISCAALLVQEAGRFVSTIYLECGAKKVNAKSIMGVMTLPLLTGEKMTITAVGKDEAEAVEALSDFMAE